MKHCFSFLLVFLIFQSGQTFSFSSQEIKQKWSSPLQDSHSQLILATGSALTLLLATNKAGLVYPVQDEVSQKKPLGEWSKFGDIMGMTVPNGIYVGGMWLHSYYSENSLSLARAAYMFDATVYAGVTTMILKPIFGERRPSKSNHYSFPSGHSTTAFAFAGVVVMEHGWYWGSAALGLASLVGYSRINDNAHYLHDVVFGATLGLAFAVSMQKFHQQQKNLTLSPIWNGADSYGLALNYHFD